MKFVNLLLLFLISALIFKACSTADDTLIVAGEVVDDVNHTVISGAVVEVIQPAEWEGKSAVTDSSGQFSFEMEIKETINIELEVTKQGYENVTTQFKLTPEAGIEDLSIVLPTKRSGGDGSDDEGNDEEGGESVGGKSGGAAALILTNLSSNTINIAETGGTVNTAFTFEVQDSAGRVVDTPVDVSFSIIRGPQGGESITPLQATTGINNSEGKVTSNLFSGDSSGTVRIEALIERPEHNLIIRSSPVLISIASGFPVAERFNIAPDVQNFDGYGINKESHTNLITASVGDMKGNPVKEGTAVYFSASNGGLVNGSAATNANGYATVNLSANGSRPSGHPRGPGFVDIVAQTIDKDNKYIEKTSTLLLTTPRADISVSPSTLSVTNGGSQTFDVTITDENGYPMAANTAISVEVGEGLTASGDIVDLELGDYFEPGEGTTNFTVTISDSDSEETVDTEGSFTITVETPSGETTTKTITGRRAKAFN